jgi:hypothetical protein
MYLSLLKYCFEKESTIKLYNNIDLNVYDQPKYFSLSNIDKCLQRTHLHCLRFPLTTEEAAGLKKVANRSDDYKNCNEKNICCVL